MKRTVLSLMALAMLSLGSIGCAEKAKTTTKTETTTPDGTTKVEDQKTIEKSGNNPPPAPVK